MARKFNGTADLIAANAAATYETTVAYSVAMWVNAAAAAAESCFYSEGSSAGSRPFIELYNQASSTGKCGLRLSNSTATSVSVSSTATVFDRTWHHVAVTQSSSASYVLYIDGVSDKSGSFTAGTPGSCNKVTIAAFGRNTNTTFYSGVVVETAKWSRQLTAAEVRSLVAGLPASHLAPDHYWPLWGVDSPEPDIGNATKVAGTLTGTSYANGAKVGKELLAL